ncbi:MAG: hypothetical protein ACK4P2_02355 [Hyphomonas sp.]
MILRRITEHVKAQNWFAVALEFFIVVLGVFVATQVSNWNEARKDREREQVYIERLRSDFEAIEARSGMAFDVWQSAVDASARLLNDIETFDPETGPARLVEQIAADFGALRAGRIPAAQAPTFIEMLSAGDVALVRDAALRDALLAYDVQAHYSLESYRVLRSDAEPGISILSDALEFNLLGNSENAADAGLGSVTTDVDVKAMVNDVRTRNAIKNLGVIAYNQRGVSAMHMQRAQDVLAALEAQE